jgi:tRNA (Thr-GGU) A37 N-methylase
VTASSSSRGCIKGVGLHPVVIRAIEGTRLLVGPIEAIDGTPVVDIKADC